MNKQLLEHYIEAYGTDIYSFCIRLTQNWELAEELYQDTFLAMCEKEDWKEEGNVKSGNLPGERGLQRRFPYRRSKDWKHFRQMKT